MRIGSLQLDSNLLLAPMAGYCDLAFRLAVRPLGGLGLACTDLVNPRGILRQTRRTLRILKTEPGDEPLCVQLYGPDPKEMAEGARWCADRGAATIDINMGCPVEKVCRRGGGAAMLQTPEVAVRVAEAVARAVDVPVTAKMRLGSDRDHIIAPQLAHDLEQVGVVAVTVHGRTADEGYSTPATWGGVAQVVEAVDQIPVIGNGDVRTPMDAQRLIDETGCAGVMIGKAALRDPWLFRDTDALLTTSKVPPPPSVADRLALADRHFEHLVRIKGERVACSLFRQRISWYAGKIGFDPIWRNRFRLFNTVQEYRTLVDEFKVSVGEEAS